MYHTWAANGQAHLFDGQDVQNRHPGPAFSLNSLEFTIELLASVRRRGRAMQQCRNGALFERAIDLLETRDNPSGLIGERQGVHDPPRYHNPNPFRQIGRYTHLRFKTSCKSLCIYCFFQRLSMTANPHAATRQPPFKIGHNLAIRPERKPDQRLRRQCLTRNRAQALGAISCVVGLPLFPVRCQTVSRTSASVDL